MRSSVTKSSLLDTLSTFLERQVASEDLMAPEECSGQRGHAGRTDRDAHRGAPRSRCPHETGHGDGQGRGAAAGIAPAARGIARPAGVSAALTIGVNDGRTAVKAGDQLTYVVSVRDGGTRSAPHLKITQTLSAGLEFLSASPHGTAANGQVAWYAGIPAGGTLIFRVVARVTRPPAQLAPAGRGRVRRGGRQQQADCLCGPPRSVACRCGRAGVPRAPGPPAWVLLAYAVAALVVLAAGVLAMIAFRRSAPPPPAAGRA